MNRETFLLHIEVGQEQRHTYYLLNIYWAHYRPYARRQGFLASKSSQLIGGMKKFHCNVPSNRCMHKVPIRVHGTSKFLTLEYPSKTMGHEDKAIKE